MTRTATLAALAATALATAACGSGGGMGDNSPEGQIKTVFNNATSALQSGNGQQFCDSLTPATAKKIASSGQATTGATKCADVVDNLLAAAKALRSQDWETFCKSIGPQAAAQIAGSASAVKASGNTCADAARAIGSTAQGKQIFTATANQLDSALKRVATGKLDKVTITGDKATATITPKQAGDKPVSFEKVDGQWRIVTGQ